MPRQPKPTPHGDWYYSKAGGIRRQLCPIADGYEAACRKLAGLLEDDRALNPPEPRPPHGTVGAFAARFLEHARVYYRLPDGRASKEVAGFVLSFRELLALYRDAPVARFGKADLKRVREAMVAAGLSRGVVNQRVGRVVRAFRWGAEEDLVPATVVADLRMVRALQKHRSPAREPPPVAGVDPAVVAATLPFLSPPVAAMVRLQQLTGMRPGEACLMRTGDLDRSGPRWVYDLSGRHKMAYKRHEKFVKLGKRSQELLTPWLRDDAPGLYLFRPADGAGRTGGAFRERYADQSYYTAVRRAARRAGVPPWSPNQLRHAFATLVRARYGLEAAQVMLGHDAADVTQLYAERDSALADRVADDIG